MAARTVSARRLAAKAVLMLSDSIVKIRTGGERMDGCVATEWDVVVVERKLEWRAPERLLLSLHEAPRDGPYSIECLQEQTAPSHLLAGHGGKSTNQTTFCLHCCTALLVDTSPFWLQPKRLRAVQSHFRLALKPRWDKRIPTRTKIHLFLLNWGTDRLHERM